MSSVIEPGSGAAGRPPALNRADQGISDADGKQAHPSDTGPIVSQKPGRILNTAARLQSLLPSAVRPRKGLLSSFKNRILLGTLVVIIGAVFIIGVTLQITVFPSLKGESAVITNLKAIHFLFSIAVIAISWLFIELISKRITLPLLKLTKRADQISREAVGKISSDAAGESPLPAKVAPEFTEADFVAGDEISQLTRSFNRMLVHLKASEQLLRESEEKYRFLFDNAPSPIFVIDAENMMILDVNARAEEEYQFTRQELLGMSFSELELHRDRDRTEADLKQFLSAEIPLLPVLRHKRKDGALLLVNFQARVSRYRDRPAIIAAVWDVTERLAKQAKLIQAGKMATLGEMATSIAHELNQPLNVIMLGCDYLAKKVKNGQSLTVDDLEHVSKELSNNVKRATRIINHLRQFGRMADEDMGPVDINAPITNVFTLVGTQLEARGIRWELDLDRSLPKIMGDANRLEQVLINLILNARDAMIKPEAMADRQGRHKPKVVTIRSFMDKGRVVVSVSDTGPGIPESIQSKIFEPFFTTKKAGEGTGLGLSISYGIIKEHNGTIEVVSGEGATFRMSFPALPHGEQV